MSPHEQLSELIRITSFSGEEVLASNWMEEQLSRLGYAPQRLGNNVWVKSIKWDDEKPVLLLNSHLDTVKPHPSWTKDPFGAEISDGKLFGLGSNDAGASLICLLHAFHALNVEERAYNIIYLASAEEENSGKNGMEWVRDALGKVDMAIVGEPTNMEVAVAEKGLMVVDGFTEGIAGHAARNTGKNALYMALDDIQAIRNHNFKRVSPTLGPIHVNVTQLEAGTQHNVVPGTAKFTIDVRLTEQYTHEEVLAELQRLCQSQLTARSMRLKPSGLAIDHPIYTTAQRLNITCFGSPTMSDQALMPWPSVKMGPGFSERSHTADEFILLEELETGVEKYIEFLKTLNTTIHETLG